MNQVCRVFIVCAVIFFGCGTVFAAVGVKFKETDLRKCLDAEKERLEERLERLLDPAKEGYCFDEGTTIIYTQRQLAGVEQRIEGLVLPPRPGQKN